MSQPCKICNHTQRPEIEQDIVSGVPNSRIASKFGFSEAAVRRHKAAGHIPDALSKSQEIKEIIRADTLFSQVKSLAERAVGILEQAEASGDLRTACMAIREARGCLELLAKAAGEIESAPTVTIINNTEWIELRTTILRAIEPYPEARDRVLAALMEGN